MWKTIVRRARSRPGGRDDLGKGFPVSKGSEINVGAGSAGFVVKVVGRGTMCESPAFHEFVLQSLNSHPGTLTVDLSDCAYLDSTFLGCILDLHRRFGGGKFPRFFLADLSESCRKLLAANRMDMVFWIVDECSEPAGAMVAIPETASDPNEVGRHILECHRRLAELGGRNAAVFGPIVEKLDRDLRKRHTQG